MSGHAPAIRRAGIGDVGDLAAMFARAQAGDALFSEFFPLDDDRARNLPALFAYRLRHALLHGEILAARSAETGELLGAAAWHWPGGAPGCILGAGLSMARAGAFGLYRDVGAAASGRLKKVNRFYEARRKRLMPGPHWYLAAIAADPVHQRRGVAGALLRFGLARAGRDRLPAYLDTRVELNVAIYEKFGFETITRDHVPGTGVVDHAMVWRAWH